MIETIKETLDSHRQNESHRTVAESRYWCAQYKLLAEQAIKAFEDAKMQRPAAWVEGGELTMIRADVVSLNGDSIPLYAFPKEIKE